MEVYTRYSQYDLRALVVYGYDTDQTIKIYRNFQRLCRNLDAHKRVFDIFPQENVYAKVLCGSLSLIVQVKIDDASHLNA